MAPNKAIVSPARFGNRVLPLNRKVLSHVQLSRHNSRRIFGNVAEIPTACPTRLSAILNVSHYCQLSYQFAARWLVAVVSSVWMLLACKSVIGFVSAFDTYLTIKYAESLDIYEQNPLGRWLMGLDQGPVCETQQIAAFITAKFLGTLLVLITIQGLAFWRVRVACMVATPVAAAQLYLVAHLLFGEG